MPRVLRVPQVNGADGSSAIGTTFPFHPDVDPQTGQPYVNEQGQPWIEILLRPITKEQHAAFVKQHTSHPRDERGTITEKVDIDAVRSEAVCYAVVSWRGVVGADGEPLPCTDAVKRVLDGFLQNQIIDRAMYARPVEVTAASFRQPGRVREVVGGLREDDRVLSAG